MRTYTVHITGISIHAHKQRHPTHTHTLIHTRIHTCVHTRIHTCVHTQFTSPKVLSVHINKEIRHTHTHKLIHKLIHKLTHTRIHTCVHTRIHTCVHTQFTSPEFLSVHINKEIRHTHIHSYIHAYIHAYIHSSSMRTYSVHTTESPIRAHKQRNPTHTHKLIHTRIHTRIHICVHTQFTSPEVLSVHMNNGTEVSIRAKKFILCTGAGPSMPSIRGLSSVKYWTYRDVMQATHVPRSVIIVGAGPLGCEVAQVRCVCMYVWMDVCMLPALGYVCVYSCMHVSKYVFVCVCMLPTPDYGMCICVHVCF
jgi:hypothetical protein